MRAFILIGVLVLLSVKVFSQGEIDSEKKVLIRNERTFYILLNTNGGGAGYSYAKMINIYRKKQWSFELVKIKDPKEIKISGDPNFRRYVYGKANDFITARVGYGYLYKLYEKKDKGGIEIRLFYNSGLSVGFLKPMYYYIGSQELFVEKFSQSNHNIIRGGASYFKGFDETIVLPGVFVKAGASFEFSKRDILLNSLEGGLILDVYPKKVEIMANDLNKFYFLSLFISYRFGKVVNPRAIKINTE
ncbi:MAG: hypothetical protein JEZ09_02470 [Salinivirgaceae bacterium]|nr:hypothetical protein [Salinivirgaceae bacterium]